MPGLPRAHIPKHLTKDWRLELHLEGWEDFARQGSTFEMGEQPEQRQRQKNVFGETW